jgi:uncharacterized protein
MRRNPVVWFEIYVQDMTRARTFYEAVLQSSLARIGPADLEMWSFGMSPDIAGTGGALVHFPGAPSGGTGTMVYFGCQDCAVEAARVAPAGGKLVREKMSIGQYGFVALGQDTEGNMFGLHSMA